MNIVSHRSGTDPTGAIGGMPSYARFRGSIDIAIEPIHALAKPGKRGHTSEKKSSIGRFVGTFGVRASREHITGVCIFSRH